MPVHANCIHCQWQYIHTLSRASQPNGVLCNLLIYQYQNYLKLLGSAADHGRVMARILIHLDLDLLSTSHQKFKFLSVSSIHWQDAVWYYNMDSNLH